MAETYTYSQTTGAALIEFHNHLRATGLLDDLISDIVAKVRETPPSREEARLRLTCAALTAVASAYSRPDVPLARWAVSLADEVLALLYPPPDRGQGGRT
ncbi:MAG: hypothetical protein Q8P41_31820 [Pseudomonadota bacterium]|nr:hypothetical protein [Pseudomonadota bacterium]